MISPQDLIDMIAQAFFQGNTQIAGIVVFTAVLALIYLVFAQRNITIGLILTLPTTLVFTIMGILPQVLTILVALVTILALVHKFRELA